MKTVIILSLFICFSFAQFTANCGAFYPNGTYVDLSVFTGYYYMLNDTAENVTIELTLCSAVGSRNFSQLCNANPLFNPNSSVNSIIDGVCVSAGDAAVATWELNPESLNGVNLIYYHGTNLSHIVDYSTRIYFQCDPTVEDENAVLTYGHFQSSISQYHFVMYTKRVCAVNAVNPPADKNITSFTCGSDALNGVFVDFSSLTSPDGGYFFPNTTGDIPAPETTNPNVTIEIQLCQNVRTRFPEICTIPSVANLIDYANNTCTPLGDITTHAWGVNPDSGNGVNLQVYAGAFIDHINRYQVRIYFECPTPAMPIPVNDTLIYEHFSPSTNSFHFIIATPLMCAALTSTSTTTASTGSSTGAATTGSSTSAATTGSSTSAVATGSSTSAVATGFTTGTSIVLLPSVVFFAITFFAMLL